MPYFVDFPVSYAEVKYDEPSEFYVEWLDNSEEFPSLSNTNDWELLKRNELNDNINLAPVEEDWSKLDGKSKPYSKIVQDSDRPQPSHRRVEYLWPDYYRNEAVLKKIPNTANKEDEFLDPLSDLYCKTNDYDIYGNPEKRESKADTVNSNEDEDSLIDDGEYHPCYIDGTYLLLQRKGMSRKAAFQSRKHLIRNLKAVDVHFDGVFQIATARNGKKKVSWQPTSNIDETTLSQPFVDTKAQALSLTSRVTHNFKKCSFKAPKNTVITKFKRFDNSEYSVCERIVK